MYESNQNMDSKYQAAWFFASEQKLKTLFESAGACFQIDLVCTRRPHLIVRYFLDLCERVGRLNPNNFLYGISPTDGLSFRLALFIERLPVNHIDRVPHPLFIRFDEDLYHSRLSVFQLDFQISEASALLLPAIPNELTFFEQVRLAAFLCPVYSELHFLVAAQVTFLGGRLRE